MFLFLRKSNKKSNKELKEVSNYEKFENAINFAKELLEKTSKITDNHPLVDLVRLLGKTLQAEYLSNLLYENRESRLPDASFDEFCFKTNIPITNDGKTFYDIAEKILGYRSIDLSKDLILPWPWRRQRLINSMAYIGRGRELGVWRQDNNHWVELWLPVGIAWVHGGNHSIASGIIQGEGKIKPDCIYNISKLYDYVICDGNNYITLEDKAIISSVKRIELAVIFEIGRLMKDNSISY